MNKNENRATRQNMVRSVLDQKASSPESSIQKARFAYWLFAVVALAVIAFAVSANAAESPSPCAVVADRIIGQFEEIGNAYATTPERVAEFNETRANFPVMKTVMAAAIELDHGRERCALMVQLPDGLMNEAVGIFITRDGKTNQ